MLEAAGVFPVTALKSILVAGIVAYAAILAFLYLSQRRLMYFPDTQKIAPASAGFTHAHALDIKTADGETLVVWYAAPSSGKPLIIYFHGNGGQIAGRANRFVQLAQDGTGLLAVSYRGYGGSSGSPSEVGLIADANAAYAYALSTGVVPGRIILMGESLGSGVAVALAAQVKSGAIILEAPFSSTADVAAATYWMFPVRWLMHDQFRSDLRIGKLNAPLLVVHGTSDPVIAIGFGEKLFALAAEPKRFLRVEGAGHQPLDAPGIIPRMKQWVSEVIK